MEELSMDSAEKNTKRRAFIGGQLVEPVT